jgi:hypothetical protein
MISISTMVEYIMCWQTDMKCFYKLPCETLNVIQQETIDYLNNYTDLLSKDSKQLWNKINTADYIKHCPSLLKYCQSLDLKIKEVAFTVVWESTKLNLHRDELPVVAKINFPILNTKGSVNSWYQIPDDLFDQYPPIINKFNQKYYSFPGIDLNKCQLLSETDLDQPIVFNSQIPHMIKMPTDAVFPRIVMPVMFFNEPTHYIA